MKIAAVIDPIEKLNPTKDTTVALLRAASKLGLDLYVMTQSDLTVENSQPFAQVSNIRINVEQDNWYSIISNKYQPLADFDIILMRKDPPFDMQYIYTTYLLELAEKSGVLVVNKPQSLRDANEKYFTMQFAEFCPKSLISQDRNKLKEFWLTHQDVIFKPLDGMGGSSIFRVTKSARNLNVIIDTLTNNGKIPIIAQVYLPAIKDKGDRRILIIDDYIAPYALARIPQGLDERGNLAQGAKGVVLPITENEEKMAKALIPALQAKGLILVGIDVIGENITEINVTSPTCMVEIEQASQEPIALLTIEKIIKLRATN